MSVEITKEETKTTLILNKEEFEQLYWKLRTLFQKLEFKIERNRETEEYTISIPLFSPISKREFQIKGPIQKITAKHPITLLNKEWRKKYILTLHFPEKSIELVGTYTVFVKIRGRRSLAFFFTKEESKEIADTLDTIINFED
tara:strand:- start:3981 stop:4409 length:429 start_codon:yes stop_codon:yes gene_type:complete